MKGKCRECGAEVLWVKMHVSGAMNPLDVAPAPKGNILIRVEGHMLYDPESLDQTPGLMAGEEEDRFVSHLSTCPKREKPAKDLFTKETK